MQVSNAQYSSLRCNVNTVSNSENAQKRKMISDRDKRVPSRIAASSAQNLNKPSELLECRSCNSRDGKGAPTLDLKAKKAPEGPVKKLDNLLSNYSELEERLNVFEKEVHCLQIALSKGIEQFSVKCNIRDFINLANFRACLHAMEGNLSCIIGNRSKAGSFKKQVQKQRKNPRKNLIKIEDHQRFISQNHIQLEALKNDLFDCWQKIINLNQRFIQKSVEKAESPNKSTTEDVFASDLDPITARHYVDIYFQADKNSEFEDPEFYQFLKKIENMLKFKPDLMTNNLTPTEQRELQALLKDNIAQGMVSIEISAKPEASSLEELFQVLHAECSEFLESSTEKGL